MNEIQPTNNNLPGTVYKPSEIIGIFNSILAKQSVNAQVVYLRGTYLASGKQSYGGYYYDTLRDEDRQEEITIIVTQPQRENLKSGNLVNVGGVIGRNVNNRGQIQINLNVSRIEVVQEQVVDEAEIKKVELRQKKASVGFKNVDSILEQLLFQDKRPNVALVFAQSSITMSDFEAGINAAKSAIDFTERRVNFANSSELIQTLKAIDEFDFTVIALIRGGGGGIEKLDDLDVLETVVNLKTPIIAAIGHVEEKLFIKQLVDKCAPTPNGLGQYFSELVETVSEKKTKSRAVLTEQIKKQFKDQLEAGKKQNEELQKKLAVLTKNQEEATKKHNEQVQALTKAQEEATKKHGEQVQAAQKQNTQLQEQLKNIQKTHKEQLDKLTEAQKTQQEQQKKQAEELSKNLTKMQETNSQLQKNLQTVTTQNTETQKQLMSAVERSKDLERQLSEAKAGNGGNGWKVIAIVAIVALIVLLIIHLMA